VRADPRIEAARFQLRGVKLVVVVLSVKGGVGKSTVASMLALALREAGLETGILDTDLSNPSIHHIFGLDPEKLELEEELGYVAPKALGGVRVSSPAFFTRGGIIPSRAKDSLEALTELLAITNWSGAEAIIVDTPPGLGDEQLRLADLLRAAYRGPLKAAVVTTPYRVSLANVEKSLPYVESAFPSGRMLVVNKCWGNCSVEVRGAFNCRFSVPRDEELDERLVTSEGLVKTKSYMELKRQVLEQLSCFLE